MNERRAAHDAWQVNAMCGTRHGMRHGTRHGMRQRRRSVCRSHVEVCELDSNWSPRSVVALSSERRRCPNPTRVSSPSRAAASVSMAFVAMPAVMLPILAPPSATLRL